MSDQPDGSVRVAFEFQDDAAARANADARARLAAGPAPGQGGSFRDRFTVTSGDRGASVTVRRGHVAVTGKQNKQQVLISVGQTASVGSNAGDALVVTGSGKLPKVLDAKGNPVAEVSTGGLFGGDQPPAGAGRICCQA